MVVVGSRISGGSDSSSNSSSSGGSLVKRVNKNLCKRANLSLPLYYTSYNYSPVVVVIVVVVV